MKDILYFYANMIKANADVVLNKAIEIASAANFECISYTSAVELYQKTLEERPDCIVTIGGDGTILRMLESQLNGDVVIEVPLMGINLGKIGFLTEITIDEFEQALIDFRNGGFSIETKSTLHCLVDSGESYNCLNDFLIFKNSFSSISHMEAWIDNDFVGIIRSDGLIVSSATGSTGYSISAGGPVVAPNLDVLLVTPICPHSLTTKPIVASFESEVRVKVLSECFLSVDGSQLLTLPTGTGVTITKSGRKVHFIRFSDRNIFKLIGEKLA